MTQALVGGLVSGSIYALLGVGIVLVFSVTRTVNMAQGEFYVYGALLASTLVAAGVPVGVAVVVAVVAVAALAAVLHRLVFARLVHAAHASQLLAALGVALALSGLARLLWGTHERSLPDLWSRPAFEVAGARISAQACILFVTLAVACGLLWFLLHRTLLGASMLSVAALSTRAGLLGVNVGLVSTAAFALAGAVGAVAGVVVTPLVFVTYNSGLLLTVYGFIAAAFGGLRSLRGAVAGGLLVGVLEAGTAYYGDSALKTPIAFSLLVAVLVYRGRREGTRRAHRASRAAVHRIGVDRLRTAVALPGVRRVADPRSTLVGAAALTVFALLGSSVLPAYWISVWAFIGVFVIVGIGLDLLLGYTGQLSLGQTSFTGIAAYLVALSVEWWGVSTWVAVAVALGGTMLLAAGIGAVVLRLRGYYFTLATLAVAIAAEALANGLPDQFGGPSGVGVTTTLGIGGFELDTPERLFAATWLVVAVVFVVAARVVRSRFGQGMRAVGFDEDMASAVAVAPSSTKLKVFVLSSLFAAVAGVLYAHILMFVSPPMLGFAGGFDAVVGLLLGGFGTIWGALVGIPVVRLLPELGERYAEYQQLIYGVAVVALVLLLPQGLVGGSQQMARGVLRRRRRDRDVPRPAPGATDNGHRTVDVAGDLVAGDPVVLDANEPVLRAERVSKRFGGITALADVDLAVKPGQVLGLIGPNGAGKSTYLSILAGSLRPDHGTVKLAGVDVTTVPPDVRAALGMARTFQLPRLPSSMTVLDVATLGAFRQGRTGLVTGLVSPTVGERTALRAAGLHALQLAGIDHLADHVAAKLSTGEQKLLELARALASAPRVLLADEPAGGLFEDEVDRLARVLRALADDGLAIVLVEHEMRLIMDICDEIVVLAEGRVIGAGLPAEVRANQEVLDAYLGV